MPTPSGCAVAPIVIDLGMASGTSIGARIRALLPRRLKRFEALRRWTIPEEVVLVREAIGDDPRVPHVMFDVGAHWGTTALPFLSEGWRVYAFEPDDENRARLHREVAAFSDQIEVSVDAVSDEVRDDVAFFSSEQSTGISGLSAFAESHVESGRVHATTIDVFCAERSIESIGFLKIDVEGFDFDVLRGVPWDRIRPWSIVCEFDQAKTMPRGYSYDDMCRYLEERGYFVLGSEWYPVTRYGGPHRWRRLWRHPTALSADRACGNLLAFLDEEHANAALRLGHRLAPVWRVATLVRHRTGI